MRHKRQIAEKFRAVVGHHLRAGRHAPHLPGSVGLGGASQAAEGTTGEALQAQVSRLLSPIATSSEEGGGGLVSQVLGSIPAVKSKSERRPENPAAASSEGGGPLSQVLSGIQDARSHSNPVSAQISSLLAAMQLSGSPDSQLTGTADAQPKPRPAELLKNALPAAGASSQNDGLKDTITQASQQLEQWRTLTIAQQDALLRNTSALQQNTSVQSKGSTAGNVLKTASSFLGGGLSAFPLISGIMSLFGGGQKQPDPVKYYVAPPSLKLEQAESRTGSSAAVYDQYGAPRVANTTPAPAPQQNVTVHVQAMDSRSFMDHSFEIAHAVRDAMLNLHSINEVVNQL